MADYNAIIQEREPKPSIYSEEEASRREAEARHYILLANDKIKEAQLIRAFLKNGDKEYSENPCSEVPQDAITTARIKPHYMCSLCGEVHPENHYAIGAVVCDSCHNKYTKECLTCGLRQPTDRFQSFPRICDECVSVGVSVGVGKQG